MNDRANFDELKMKVMANELVQEYIIRQMHLRASDPANFRKHFHDYMENSALSFDDLLVDYQQKEQTDMFDAVQEMASATRERSKELLSSIDADVAPPRH